jgi:Lon protease-like protein
MFHKVLTPGGPQAILAGMNLPEQVAVMPLPNAILFPRVLLPLYIFEPRYKEMLAKCLAGDRIFAVALLPEGWERKGKNAAPYHIATVGVVRTCIGRSDGTSNLILEGIARVDLVRYVQLHPYRVAQIEPLESVLPKIKTTREPLVSAVAKLAKARAKIGAELPKSVVNSLLAVDSPDQLSDLVSYTLLDNYHQKQLMLETLDVNQRLRKLVRLLEEQIRQFELWKTLQGNLSNDDVGHN